MARGLFNTEGIPEHLDGDFGGDQSNNSDSDKNVSRRDFIKAGLATLGGLFIVGNAVANEARHYLSRDPVFKIEFDNNDEGMSFDEAAALAIRFDKAFDRLPVPEFANTPEELTEFALELLPQFEHEGIVSQSHYPEVVEFTYYTDGNLANQVLGQSNCSTYAKVNGRITFETSTWGDTEALFTIAHELTHVQQSSTICYTNERSLVENSAQIGAMEVVCGLANQGNPMYLWAAIDELRGMTLSAALGLALKENRMGEFEELRQQLSPGAFSEARFQKSQRRWTEDPVRLAEILEWYNVTPINMIIKAIRENNNQITGLAFPEIDTSRETGVYGSSEPLTLALDDTAWVIEHLEELVDWSAANFPRP